MQQTWMMLRLPRIVCKQRLQVVVIPFLFQLLHGFLCISIVLKKSNMNRTPQTNKKMVQFDHCNGRWDGVEDTRLEGKDTKKSKAENSPSENRPSRGQGQSRKCSPKEKGLQNFDQTISTNKRSIFQAISRRGIQKESSQIFREVFGVFQQNFEGSKTVLSSSRGQGNFRGLEASRQRTSKLSSRGQGLHLWLVAYLPSSL